MTGLRSQLRCSSAWLSLAALLVVASSGCGANEPPDVGSPSVEFVARHAWHDGRPVWLKADLHTHTTFSDGALSIDALVHAASQHGCDVIAITDHADHNLQGASAEYFAAIGAARQKYPDVIILAGVEWNIPPYGGDEHVTVVVEPTPAEAEILSEFKARFDDYERDDVGADFTIPALQWLTERCQTSNTLAVVCYNHPSRKRLDVDGFDGEFQRLQSASPFVVGFEGAAGHQAAPQLDGYSGPNELVERWDPMAAEVGGEWDQLLRAGVDAWGALAPSDFHSNDPADLLDFLPGEFSETWLMARDKTAKSVLEAWRAGSFFGAHGHVVRDALLSVSCEGLPRPARPGESIAAPPGSKILVVVSVSVPGTDWRGQPNIVDEMELIGVTNAEAMVLKTQNMKEQPGTLVYEADLPEGGLTVRARGRRIVPDAPDLMFYTNPVRIVAQPLPRAAAEVGH